MMQRFILQISTLVLLALSFKGYAQNGLTGIHPKPKAGVFNYANEVFLRSGYMAAVDSLLEIEAHYTPDTVSFQEKGMFYQAAMTFTSFAGLHPLALKYEQLAFPRRNTVLQKFERAVRVEPAAKYIIDHYGEEPIIMFNEAHSRGQNRAFMRDLLPALYEKGFRCLAIETLDYTDSTLNQRGYPTLKTGYYLREPAFGQLIREALELGFDLLPYEDTTTVYNQQKTYLENQNSREQAQAENIAAYQKEHPGTKMVVYAGHGHIEKKSDGEWVKMAQRLCKLIGRNVPSIECTAMKERYNTQSEDKTYRAVLDSFQIKVPAVLFLNDSIFISSTHQGKVDVSVFLPRTNGELGYPDWMKASEKHYKELTLSTTPDLTGRLLQVYKANEWEAVGENAIPVLLCPIDTGKTTYKLYLKPGAYVAMVFHTYEEKLFEFPFSVR